MTKPKKSRTTTKVDVESNTTTTGATSTNNSTSINNPYSSAGLPPVLPTYHPINVLKRTIYIGGAGYCLHTLKAPSVILHSPKVSHEWFKIGLAGTIAILALKAYVELYAGKVQSRKVCYQNFKSETHAVMALLFLTSMAFHVALWPHYGSNTFVVLFLLGVILLNSALLLPTPLQNIISVIGMTFFLQEYK